MGGLFEKGHAKLPNSGMKKGQKTRKTLAREAEKINTLSEKQILSQQVSNIESEEEKLKFLMDTIKVDPLVELAFILKSETASNVEKIKAAEIMAKKIYSDKKAVEQKVEQITEIVISKGSKYDEPAIEATVLPMIEQEKGSEE